MFRFPPTRALPTTPYAHLPRPLRALRPPQSRLLKCYSTAVTDWMRTAVIAGQSALAAVRDPTKADAVGQLGEATGGFALRRMYFQMLADPNGSRLLRDRPRINTTTMSPA